MADGNALPMFTSRRGEMSADELRALNDDLALKRLLANLDGLDARAAASRPKPAGLDEPDPGPGPRVRPAGGGGAGLNEPPPAAANTADAPDRAPTRAPGPPVKDIPDFDGMGFDYTGRLKERYGPLDVLLPPKAAYKAWGNITNRPLAKLYPELSWADRVFPTEKRRMAEKNAPLYLEAQAGVADRGLIEREIRDRYKPQVEKLGKEIKGLDPSKRQNAGRIAEKAKELEDLNRRMEEEILSLGDVTPEDVRDPVGKGIEGNRSKFWKDVKGKGKVGLAGLATLGTGIAGTIAFNAIRRSGEEEGSEAAADAIQRFVTGGEISEEDEALVRKEFTDEEFSALSVERSKRRMTDALGPRAPGGSDPLYFTPPAVADPSAAPLAPPPTPGADAGPVIQEGFDFGGVADRYAMGEPVTSEEVAYLAQFVAPETMDELTRYRDSFGGDMSPRAEGQTRQDELRAAGYDVPDYAVPEISEAESTLSAAEVANLAATDPGALPGVVANAKDERELDQVRNFVDAGIQNFAGAVGLPSSVQEGLRNAAEGARTGETADVVPDTAVSRIWDGYSNLWSDYIAEPYQAWNEGGDPANPEFLRRPAAWAAKRVLPEDWYQAYEDYGVGEFIDPVNYADMILGTTTDEFGQGAYNLAREGLTALEAEGTTPRNFVEPYRKILGDLGGQPLRYPEERRFDQASIPLDPRAAIPPGSMPAAPPPAPGGIDFSSVPPGSMPPAADMPPMIAQPPFLEPQAPAMPDFPPPAEPAPFDVGSLIGFGPAYAGAEDEEQVNAVITDLIDQDEVAHPKGQTDDITREALRPRERPAGLNEDAAPSVDTSVPMPQPTTGVAPSSAGRVGDFNATRSAVQEQGPAGLADDAAAAEEELNWINRQMRDRMGMDASQRAKAAEALISFGSTVLASRGDDWQALGEGIQAGYGTVSQMNDEEAAALAAQQEMILEDNRWRQEMALKELAARRGGGGGAGGMPADIQKLEYLTGIFFEQLMATGEMTADQAAAEAQKMATDRIFEQEASYF